MQKKLIQFFLFVIFFGSIYNVNAQPKNEFRGVWIATVSNIDWPLSKDYNTASQKAEFIRQLDLHKKNGMNAVIVQVRQMPLTVWTTPPSFRARPASGEGTPSAISIRAIAPAVCVHSR